MWKVAIMGLLANLGMLRLLNNRGEVTPPPDPNAVKTFNQEQVDRIVQDRLAREQAKFADYDTIKQKVTEFERLNNEKTQKELEEKKQYDEAKKTYEQKIADAQGLINKKDAEIVDMKVGNSLMGEIVKQNAYADETMALIKSQAVYDPKTGAIRIKGVDANGLEIMDSIEEGIKKFLTQRPHLVKAAKAGGAGTATGNQVAGSGAGEGDLNTLNAEYLAAQQRGDQKEMNRLRPLMQAAINKGRTKL
jgi:hypothetical protein